MPAVVALIVLAVSLAIYAKTKHYGEAALALSAGMLSVYAVQWTPGGFVGYVLVWLSFSFLIVLGSGLSINAQLESIYLQAGAFCLSKNDDVSAVAAELRAVGEAKITGSLGPVVRAEVIRLFAFRTLPIEYMGSGLNAVSMLTMVTKLEPLEVARFIADVTKGSEGIIDRFSGGQVVGAPASAWSRSRPPFA